METTCVATNSEFEHATVTASSTVERGRGSRGSSGRTGWRAALATAVGLLATTAFLTAPSFGLTAAGPTASMTTSTTTSTTPTTTSRPLQDTPQPRDATNVSYGPLPEQALDVHLPSGGAGPFPVVVFAHAGGWIGGTRTALPDVIDALITDVGAAVVSIDYRLVGTAPDGSYVNTFPTSSYDMDRAIRFVRANARRWNLDPNRIIVAGASAGGQLAALAGVAPGVYSDPALPDDLVRVSPVVQGVIDYVGPSDFGTFAQAGGWAPALTAALLDCAPERPDTCDPARVAAASIAPHLSAASPPAYLAYGEQDSLVVPATQGAPLAAAWASRRGDLAQPDPARRGVWYEQQANADHTFDVANSDYQAMERWVRAVVAGQLA